MRMFKVAAGTSGVSRDLRKYCSFSAWKAPIDVLFNESEMKGYVNFGKDIKSSYIFVRGMTEYSVPSANVVFV